MGTPRWRIQIVKSLGAHTWSNDYLTDDATIEDAQDLGALLVTFERTIHQTTVLFVYMRVSSYLVGDRHFRHFPLNLTGIDTAADSLPLFNTIRMDMGTSDSDPARKYYRIPVAEGAQTNGIVNGAVLTSLNSVANTQLVTSGVIGHIVTTAGHPCLTAQFSANVQIRQLTRRKRKKVTA